MSDEGNAIIGNIGCRQRSAAGLGSTQGIISQIIGSVANSCVSIADSSISNRQAQSILVNTKSESQWRRYTRIPSNNRISVTVVLDSLISSIAGLDTAEYNPKSSKYESIATNKGLYSQGLYGQFYGVLSKPTLRTNIKTGVAA